MPSRAGTQQHNECLIKMIIISPLLCSEIPPHLSPLTVAIGPFRVARAPVQHPGPFHVLIVCLVRKVWDVFPVLAPLGWLQ